MYIQCIFIRDGVGYSSAQGIHAGWRSGGDSRGTGRASLHRASAGCGLVIGYLLVISAPEESTPAGEVAGIAVGLGVVFIVLVLVAVFHVYIHVLMVFIHAGGRSGRDSRGIGRGLHCDGARGGVHVMMFISAPEESTPAGEVAGIAVGLGVVFIVLVLVAVFM